MQKDYHTLKGYDMIENKQLTYAMEDYLEMIVRICSAEDYARVSTLSKLLNVKPSSVTKMVNNLKRISLVQFEKYGHISLTQSGRCIGEYLIYRHNTLNHFLCLINNTQDELEQVEKIEHFFDKRTIENISLFLQKHDIEKQPPME